MKKLLSIIFALTIILAISSTVSAEYPNPFVDVPEDEWYYDEVVEAFYTGIINGKTATEFKPDQILPENVVICKHPKNVTGQHAEKVQFKVETKGQNGPFTYQWLIQTPDNEIPLKITDGFTWAEGQYTDTLTVTVDSKKLTSDYKFRCVVTDTNGKKTYSKEAYVIVTEAANVDLRDSSESKSDMIVLMD